MVNVYLEHRRKDKFDNFILKKVRGAVKRTFNRKVA
jgi:hypothetical protein